LGQLSMAQWRPYSPSLAFYFVFKKDLSTEKERLNRKDSTFQSCCFGSACSFPALFDGLNAFR
jgi:hypothetical protein